MFAISPPVGGEWLILLALAVLLFGAKKLPELGSSVGRSIRNFKQGIEEGKGDESPDETEAAGRSSHDQP